MTVNDHSEDKLAVSKNADSQQHSEIYSEWKVLPITTLTSVATVIGSGILALPVTMYHTSIDLFLLVFTIALLAQIATVYVTIYLLQQSRIDEPNFTRIGTDPASQPIHNRRSQHSSSISSASSVSDIENAYDTFPASSPAPSVAPTELSLVTLARLYLPSAFLRFIFHVTSFLTFVSLLVSYGLAGPQAIWQLMHPPPAPPTPPLLLFFLFCFIGVFSIVFFVDYLLPFFSSLTVVKGSLFVAVVIIVAFLPQAVRIKSVPQLFSEPIHWASAPVPFLMSTIALGGLPMTIPVTYRLLPTSPTSQQMYRYRTSIVVALIICYILNIGWVMAVLDVVPRDAPQGHPSLTNAITKGQISTVPLIEALGAHETISPGMLYTIDLIVQLFILFSTVVSFFVIAAGCKNYMDGAADSIHTEIRKRNTSLSLRSIRYLAYFVSFGSILVIILSDPEGFIKVLTRLAATVENVQSGFMLFLMAYFCHRTTRSAPTVSNVDVTTASGSNAAASSSQSPYSSTKGCKSSGEGIPLPLSRFTLMFVLPVTASLFLFAVLLASIGPYFGVQLSVPTE